jgi:hypothetical protein
MAMRTYDRRRAEMRGCEEETHAWKSLLVFAGEGGERTEVKK